VYCNITDGALTLYGTASVASNLFTMSLDVSTLADGILTGSCYVEDEALNT
jgi:hypothetical protein